MNNGSPALNGGAFFYYETVKIVTPAQYDSAIYLNDKILSHLLKPKAI